MILVLNCGSSSIKFQLIEPETRDRALSGLISEIGTPRARATWQAGSMAQAHDAPGLSYEGGIALLLDAVRALLGGTAAIRGVGHRVVHGGEHFAESTLVTPAVIAAIESVVPLAPLHNPANLLGIRLCQQALPTTPQVAVFDTAFHQTLPEAAYLYAIPYELYERHRLRRYGFHGTSHRYVSARAAELLGRQGNVISLHLGNGCSAAAIRAGRSVATSMGLTPLEGLVMGTRSGDVDPALLGVIAEREGLTLAETEALLNKRSGLLGLSGTTSDVRLLIAQAEAGDGAAQRALAVFVQRAKQYVGAYLALLGEVDALIFTGGIGENAAPVRAAICAGLAPLGLALDEAANQEGRARTFVQQASSRTAILVIPTDEEGMIALDTARLVGGG